MRPVPALLIIIVAFLLAACSGNSRSVTDNGIAGDSKMKHARRFTIERHNDYSVLTITDPWQGAKEIHQEYILAERGKILPQTIDTSKLIRVPLKRIIAMSTTYLPMITALGERSSLAGISGSSLLYDTSIINAVKKGVISDVGYDDNLDKEQIIKIGPDLVMVYGVGGESSALVNKLKDLGFKVMYNADYLEEDPLGKAEWLKVFGALFCRERMADSIFSSIERSYDSVKTYVSTNSKNRPEVMLGLPWKDTWYISPGNSYISNLIDDAGGEYLWKGSSSETAMPYSLESVWMKALNAEYWLNISTVRSRNEILAVDPRLGELPPFRSGKMFNNVKRISSNGGIDYWESGALKPHIILRDLAMILHPELFNSEDYYYYIRVR